MELNKFPLFTEGIFFAVLSGKWLHKLQVVATPAQQKQLMNHFC
jgi:hypothetical protein